jgi:hypothetical protein
MGFGRERAPGEADRCAVRALREVLRTGRWAELHEDTIEKLSHAFARLFTELSVPAADRRIRLDARGTP